MLKYCLLLCALAAMHSASASPRPGSHPAPDPFQTWKGDAATALSARGDAGSLATAAALRHGAGATSKPAAAGQSSLELAARASELAPQNAAIGWLNLQLCAGTPGCDFRDIATAMRWVDADNAAAWLQTLAAAQKDKDPTEVDRILADMARASRFDFYGNRVVVMMVDALHAARRDLPGSFAASDSARLTTAGGIAGGEVIPTLAPLTEVCRESAPERRELCVRLSKTMQHSDSVAAQLAGFSIEKRLLAPDSKEARTIAERRRVLEWRIASAAKADSPLLPWTKNTRAREKLAFMRAMPRDEDVCTAILRAHKMALEPPEGHP